MINRADFLRRVDLALKRSPIVALLGPRQCGKTTLAREVAKQYLAKECQATFFDLESPVDQQRLQNPELMLSSLNGTVILDEIQIKPELFNILRILVDDPNNSTKYLILGSASPHIIKNVSETLAGRVEFIEMTGFSMQEIEPLKQLWLRGGFPRSFLANSEQDSWLWREDFIRTFLERDIPMLGIKIASTAMRRFWTMLAHFHAQTWNASEIGRSMGLTDKTVRSYLDILSATFMIRQLQPWHENLNKRQVKAPKIYFRDSGLLHNLLNIPDEFSLMGNPKLGASWEGFALEQLLQIIKPNDAYFWSTYSGAEIDLLFFYQGKRYGVEFKFNEAPKATKSMHIAVADLSLDHLWIVYPGKDIYPVTEKIRVIPLSLIDKQLL